MSYTDDNVILSNVPSNAPPPRAPGAPLSPTLAMQHCQTTSYNAWIACAVQHQERRAMVKPELASTQGVVCMHDKICKACRVVRTLKISSAATYCSGAMQCAGGLGGVLFAVVAREEQGEALGGWPPEVEAWHGPSGGGSCLLTDYNRPDDKCQ